MTQLPLFPDERQARRWIASCWAATLEPVSLEHAQRYTFAIIRSDTEHAAEVSRFVGSVSLSRGGLAAYLSFWVGIDYQHQGIGTRAVQLATRAAFGNLAVRYLFAAAFRDNAPSHRVMLRTGWQKLPFAGAPPSDGIDFFQRRAGENRRAQPARSHRLLDKLLRDIGSDFALVPRSLYRSSAFPGPMASNR